MVDRPTGLFIYFGLRLTQDLNVTAVIWSGLSKAQLGGVFLGDEFDE
jgi:hypothetical protein